MDYIHCPMIHGGLQINLIHPSDINFNHCCLRTELYQVSMDDTVSQSLWNDSALIPLRDINNKNIWDKNCWTCQGNELAGLTSFRTGMLDKFGYRKNLKGPQRLDLMFDIGCNLACRTCGPELSTYWQQHLTKHHIKFTASTSRSRVNDMISILKTLDLSDLEMVVFCGGETLLGQGYWQIAEAIADQAPHSQEKIILCFQTNGTQSINEKNYKTIEKFRLMKQIGRASCRERV